MLKLTSTMMIGISYGSSTTSDYDEFEGCCFERREM